MVEWQKVKINSFLKERESRIKPAKANKMELKRLNKINFSGEIHLVDKPTNTDMILVKSDDLVISGINVEKGAVAVYQGKEDILATIHYSSYIFDETKIDIEYFKTFLKSKAFREVINSQIRSGIKTELKAKNFLPLEINLPDLETQRKIRNKINLASDKISELFNIDNKNESLISCLRQQILQEAVQGKLVKQDPKDESASELLKKIKSEKDKLIKEGKIKKEKPLTPISDEEKPFELPKGWEWVRLGDILTFNYGKGNKDNSGSVPVYGANGVLRYSLKPLVKEKCIVVGRKGSAGALNIVDEPSWPSDVSYYIIPPKNTKFMFIFYLLKTLHLESIGKGIKPGLNRNEVYILPIGLPPLFEQTCIVEKVDKLMALCDELENQVKENQDNSRKLIDVILKESFEVNDGI